MVSIISDKMCPKCNEMKEFSEFYKNGRTKDGLYCYCKSCHGASTAKWQGDNSDKGRAYRLKHINKDGYCVYRATYPSGVYIGSGQAVGRRQDHLNGSSGIAKTLGEKALTFEVFYRADKENCRKAEGIFIDLLGLENILNSQRA